MYETWLAKTKNESCEMLQTPQKKLKSTCLLGTTGQKAEGKGSQNWKWILKPKPYAVEKRKSEAGSEQT